MTAIDRALHLQQIVKLPSVHGVTAGDLAQPSVSSQATIPAKKPIRQQPKGLMMRFTPIGSGRGEAGRIGTPESDSDLDMEDATPKFRTPITTSKSDSSDVESDVEMNNAPSIPVEKAKSDKSSKADSKTKSTEKSLKRKHKDTGITETKKSSSMSRSTNGPQLKRVKTKQAKSEEAKGDARSASTEDHQVAPIGLSFTGITPSKVTPIPPPKSTNTAQMFKTSESTKISSFTPTTQAMPPVHSQSKEFSPPSQGNRQSLEDRIKAIKSNASLTDKQRKREVKKLKRSHSSSFNESSPSVEGTTTPNPPPSSKVSHGDEIAPSSNILPVEVEEASKSSSKSKRRKREKGEGISSRAA